MSMPQDHEPAKFNMIWRNLDRAFSMPVFSRPEVTLLQVARELSYTASMIDGSQRAKPFTVNCARLAERRGLIRETLSRAVADLLSDKVFLGNRDALRINKQYRQWTGKHALTERQIRECDDAMDTPVTTCGEVLISTKIGFENPSTDKDNTCDAHVTVVTPTSQTLQDKATPSCDAHVTSCDAHVTNLVTPTSQITIGNARASVESINSEERDDDDVCGKEAPNGARTPKRPLAPDPAEIRRIQDWSLTVSDPLEEIPSKVHQFASSYPLDWIEAAILCGVVGSKPGSAWRYAHKCLLSWWSKGQPDHEEIREARQASIHQHVNGKVPSKRPKLTKDLSPEDQAAQQARLDERIKTDLGD